MALVVSPPVKSPATTASRNSECRGPSESLGAGGARPGLTRSGWSLRRLQTPCSCPPAPPDRLLVRLVRLVRVRSHRLESDHTSFAGAALRAALARLGIAMAKIQGSQYLTPSQVAELLHVSPETVRPMGGSARPPVCGRPDRSPSLSLPGRWRSSSARLARRARPFAPAKRRVIRVFERSPQVGVTWSVGVELEKSDLHSRK